MTDYERERVSNLIKAMNAEEKKVVVMSLPTTILASELDRRDERVRAKMRNIDSICLSITPESTFEDYESAIRAIRNIAK